jgi:ATP-dependent helicase/nuclease subunit A
MSNLSHKINKTNKTGVLSDAPAREKALNPAKSFIIQAPAGSGKTQLLTLRILNLLAHAVTQPEQILAITFTNKAAKEMQARIKSALLLADNKESEITDPLKKQMWDLANLVRKKDLAYEWDLTTAINRLNIMTIDSFCAKLISMSPQLSGIGGEAQISQNPQELYEKAALALIKDKNSPLWADALPCILKPLENNMERFIRLCCDLLAKREQWLPVISAIKDVNTNFLEEVLLNSLNILHEQSLEKLELFLTKISFEQKEVFYKISNFIIKQDLDDLSAWQKIADKLLTKDNNWRSRLTYKEGFPPKTKFKELGIDDTQGKYILEIKQIALDFLNNLDKTCWEQIKNILEYIKLIPDHTIDQINLSAIQALTKILPTLAAHFRIACTKSQQVDFNEVSIGALNSLGSEQSPTDLNLILDYQIKHLLVDEFQDTSLLQYSLIKSLISGWEPDDGKTVFFVGDPMQSIYRFRQADVSLFMQVKKAGLGEKKCEFLSLTSNFRTETSLINFINNACESFFPKESIPELGAVNYANADPVIANTQNQHVFMHKCELDSKSSGNISLKQTNKIISHIKIINKTHKADKIAILVRSRTHLSEIIPALIKNKIPFNAIEIESLYKNQLVLDYLSFGLAISQCADKTSWYALLRSPLIGLTKLDLEKIADFIKDNNQITIFEAIKSDILLNSLSGLSKTNIKNALPILQNAINTRRRDKIAKVIYKSWVKLNGPVLYDNSQDEININLINNLLEINTSDANNLNQIINHQYIEDKLKTLFSSSTDSSAKLELMTIHKAKGLEFDHVFIPALDKRTMSDKSSLILWQTNLKIDEPYLLIAPFKSQDKLLNKLYLYLRFIESQKASYESQRLLYVALTRAKKSLYLFYDEDITKKSQNMGKSFLDLLGQVVNNKVNSNPDSNLGLDLDNNIYKKDNSNNFINNKHSNQIKYISSESSQAEYSPNNRQNSKLNHPDKINQIEYSLQEAGKTLHFCIEQLSIHDISKWTELIPNLNSQIKFKLAQAGLSTDDINKSFNKITQALKNMCECEHAKWILNKDHIKREHEFSLYIYNNKNKKLEKRTIDCWFIDKNNDIYIIDFKLNDAEDINSQLKIYSQQLSNYKNKLAGYLDSKDNQDLAKIKSIKTGLYFPLVKKIIFT